MATSNFYQDGNHGLNVILTGDDEDDTSVEDTLSNIVDELNEIGYSVDEAHIVNTPRSFDTGQQFLVYNKKGDKAIALLELCAGYYSGANVNVYTGDALDDETDEEYVEVTKNKRDVTRVVDIVKSNTQSFRRTATFSNGESIYERGE